MNFQDDEARREFDKLAKHLNYTDYTYTSKTCGWDVELNYKGKTYYIELKYRKGQVYDTTLLEEHKYQTLKQFPNSYYIFFEGATSTAQVFTVGSWIEDIKIEDRWMPKTTDVNTGHKTKQLRFLPKNKAKIINYA